MDHKQFRFYCQTGNLKQMREGLCELSEAQKVEYFKEVLQTPLRTEVLEYIGSEIVRMQAHIGAPLLVDLLYSEEAATRNLAVELFTGFGKQGIEVLSLHLNDLDADVRLFTIQALVQIPCKDEVLYHLRKQLEVEKEMNIITAIIESLGDLGNGVEDADAIRTFMEKSDHPFLQFVARRALLRLEVSS